MGDLLSSVKIIQWKKFKERKKLGDIFLFLRLFYPIIEVVHTAFSATRLVSFTSGVDMFYVSSKKVKKRGGEGSFFTDLIIMSMKGSLTVLSTLR